jgi:transposase
MVMKVYPPEFKADAVALYRSRPGVTIAHIADELGINRETLRNWIRKDDDARPTQTSAPAKAARPHAAPATSQSLEAENERLRAQVAELETEREILRKAAAYFAGEMKP